MAPQSRALILYKNTVMLLGFAVFLRALIGYTFDVQYLPELAVFFVLILAGEILPIKRPSSSDDFTMTVPAVISLLLSHGPLPTIVIGTMGIFVGGLISHRTNNLRWLISMAGFNTALAVLSIGAACIAFRLGGGLALVDQPEIGLASMILPLILATIALSTVNVVLFSAAISIFNQDPLRLSLAQNLRWAIPNYFITAPSAVLFAYLYQQFGVYGILMIIVPFLVGRQALNIYSQQTQAYRETITTLGAYMQEYHPYTRGHLERVANLADKVARTMGLPTQSLMFIRDAGLLHDIGKVGVDEAVLDKIGKLTDEEWATIKQHPATGGEILAQMKHLESIVPWVRGHHERPDGRGYPDGLKMNEIPLEAAVLAVADAFDAMTGRDEKDTRVYRKPLTRDEAIDQVRYGAGTQFDPRVVKAFMRVMFRKENTPDV